MIKPKCPNCGDKLHLRGRIKTYICDSCEYKRKQEKYEDTGWLHQRYWYDDATLKEMAEETGKSVDEMKSIIKQHGLEKTMKAKDVKKVLDVFLKLGYIVKQFKEEHQKVWNFHGPNALGTAFVLAGNEEMKKETKIAIGCAIVATGLAFVQVAIELIRMICLG